ncbi:MAG TPA: hypothetical protein VK464_01920, partial [Symbiobacteriaceae bacterium]|nr:hypothetical protein [Symbiobacteriaceae bacterium]
MQKRGMRYAAGLLVSGLLVGLTAPDARAAGISAPWFGNVSVGAPSSSDPFRLIASYVPFWSYVEGLPWVAYTEWRVSLTAVPSIYTARPATPLPTLEAQPAFATAVARVVQA